MPKEIKWYKVADNTAQLDFQSNNMCVSEANSKKITIAR